MTRRGNIVMKKLSFKQIYKNKWNERKDEEKITQFRFEYIHVMYHLAFCDQQNDWCIEHWFEKDIRRSIIRIASYGNADDVMGIWQFYIRCSIRIERSVRAYCKWKYPWVTIKRMRHVYGGWRYLKKPCDIYV